MRGWSEGGEWELAKGCSPDVRKQMVQRVVGRPRVRGVGAIGEAKQSVFRPRFVFLLFLS